MATFTVTPTTSNITFYTTKSDVYFADNLLAYQLVYVDQGGRGRSFAAIKSLVTIIESGSVQSVQDLAAILPATVTLEYRYRRPWLIHEAVIL